MFSQMVSATSGEEAEQEVTPAHSVNSPVGVTREEKGWNAMELSVVSGFHTLEDG